MIKTPNTNVMQAAGLITYVRNEEEPELLSTLGGRVKWARGRRDLSQPELAEAAKVSQGTIGNLESGIRKKPRELLAIARALKVNPSWLETGKGDWDAAGHGPVRGRQLFDSISEEEQRLLENFRAMLDDDQRAFAEDIAARAAKMRAYTAKVLEKVGAKSKPVKNAADARSTAVARSALEVTDRLKQKSLLEPGHPED